MRIREQVARAYFTADGRTTGLGRIGLASVLLADLINRALNLQNFYTNAGVLPNHTLLWRPPYDGVFSFFFMASEPVEAKLGFLVCAAAYLCLLVGFRTRLAHVASFLCVLSLHGRLLLIQNGGDVVLGELCLWTMFLPTGRRFSIDSLLERLRVHPERSADELGDRRRFEPDGRPVVSLAVGAIVVQLVLIYALNALQKNGVTWRTGSVVHYVLHQDRIVTSLGLWVRGWITPGQSLVLTRAAVIAETMLPMLLLSPLFQRASRHFAIAVALMLHLGFVALLDLDMFTPAMIAFLPFLVPATDWDALEGWWLRRPGSRVIIFDAGCGICFQIMRVLARLDGRARLRFVPSSLVGGLVGDLGVGEISPALVDQTIVVIDPATRRQWVRAAAFGEIARFLPAGLPFTWLVRIPGVRQIADAAYDAFARRRSRISAALAMAACGFPVDLPGLQGLSAAPTPPVPAVAHPRGWIVPVREFVVVMVIVAAGSQVLVDNPILARVLPLRRPVSLDRAATYLQLFQGWSMFAPEAPTTDMNISVDAVTIDGRHVDPFNEAANSRYPFPGASIPAHLDQNPFFCEYLIRIPWQPEYHQAFTEWILRYPERTGSGKDRIVSFHAYLVEDDSPPPGERQPRNVRTKVFLKYPENL